MFNLKKSFLVLALLALVSVCSAQVLTNAVISSPSGATRSDFAGLVGWEQQVNNQIVVTKVGRWVVAGNTGSHVLNVYTSNIASTINPTLAATVTVNTSGATTGQFLYGTLSSPLTIASGTYVYVASTEADPGDSWYDTQVLTFSSDWEGGSSLFQTGIGQFGFEVANQSYVPVDIIYTNSITGGGPTLFTLTVNNGTGSGSYTNGQVVSVSTNAPFFSAWSANAAIANINLASTTVTMPSNNLTITANYTNPPNVWYIDNSLTNSANTGTNWANAYTNAASEYSNYYNSPFGINSSPGTIKPGDTIYISGGPFGSSQIYYYTNFGALNICGADGVHTGLTTMKVGQDSMHDGTAIFDGSGQDFSSLGLVSISQGSNILFSGISPTGTTNLVFRNVNTDNTTGKTDGHAILINVPDVTLEYLTLTNIANGINVGSGSTGDTEFRYLQIIHICRDHGIAVGNANGPDSVRIHHVLFSGCINYNTNALPYQSYLSGPDLVTCGASVTVHDCVLTHELDGNGNTSDSNVWNTAIGSNMQHPDDFQGVANFTKIYNNILHSSPGSVFEQQPPNDGFLNDIYIVGNLFINDQDSIITNYFFSTTAAANGCKIYESGYDIPLYSITNIYWLNNTFVDFAVGIGQAWQQTQQLVNTNVPTPSNIDWTNNPIFNHWVMENNISISNNPAAQWCGFGSTVNTNFSTNNVITLDNVVMPPPGQMGFATNDVSFIQNATGINWTPTGTITSMPTFKAYTYRAAGNDFHLSTNDVVAQGQGTNLTTLFTTLGIPRVNIDGTNLPSSGNWDIGALGALGGTPSTNFTLTVINGTGTGSYTNSQVVTIAANSPVSGTYFTNWSGGGVEIANSNLASTTITMTNTALTVTANYGTNPPSTFTLTVVHGTGSGTYTNGQVVSVSANSAVLGTYFTNWSGGAVQIANSNSANTTFTLTTANATITANYGTNAIPPPVIIGLPIVTYGGTGTNTFNGDNIQSTNANMSVASIVVDQTGNTYFADTANNRIRVIGTNGVVTTIAGNGTFPYFSGDGGPATNASLYHPYGIAINNGTIYIADTFNQRIRMITNGIITTIAGDGTFVKFKGDNGAATNASLNDPASVAIDALGRIFIADTGNNRIRMITNGIISTVAGSGKLNVPIGDGNQATAARLSAPFGISFDLSGNLLIADQLDNRIRKVNLTTGIISTIAGSSFSTAYSGDGSAATSAKLGQPTGVVSDVLGNIYVTDTQNNRIRIIGTNGVILSLAGTGSAGFSTGSASTNSALHTPISVALDQFNNLFIADYNNNRIRVVTTNTAF